MIIPNRLQPGDTIRILSPSSNIARIGGVNENEAARKNLEELGYKVTFSKNIEAQDAIGSSSIKERLEDLHEAFANKEVKAILTSIGGFNSNELLPYIDYQLIKKNPKIICGYSDITALNNAITSKTGLVTYIGPHYSSFKMNDLQDYQTDSFLKACASGDAVTISSSTHYSDDLWFLPDRPRNLRMNTWKTYTGGKTKALSCGGNLNTFIRIQGTPFQHDMDQKLWFVESAEEHSYQDFASDLSSLLQVATNPKGLIVGRFPKETGMTEVLLLHILEKYPILKEIPVLYNVNFGHTQPIFTFPLGQEVQLDADKQILSF
ncbi:putative murein peptide carboxypeptidase [Jeotgalibaca dankookensis]|uniref:Putative murein peptide carboxypeptidase n=1 Tax=Jeotgalibaca dankookensis TaxID=708126 RepID=A0A1S6IPW6_9LACT|nr:S66 peptidase family protein [Jeotgalibaca dankookensis]AQS53594.1 putative murein peptide carboxypeptidase [Jeotgalibaca dankookensis]